jgi:predicted O-methyltransferase YrrM
MFKDNLQYFIGRNMVHVCQGRSDDAHILEQFDEASIDYIMVDGAHEYEPVIDDIQNWWPKLKPNGVMFGDDYNLSRQYQMQ